MSLETGTYIDDLAPANPLNSDVKSQGAGHLRLIKTVLQNSFPNIDGAVTATPAQLNLLASNPLAMDYVTADTALDSTSFRDVVSLPLAASSVYAFESCIAVSMNTSDDARWDITYPGGTAVKAGWAWNRGDASTVQAASYVSTVNVDSSGANPDVLVITGFLTTTLAGDLAVRFGKNTDVGADGTIHKGSWLQLKKLA